ncbi:YeaC family protein, partial [Pseudomonas viridiflava]
MSSFVEMIENITPDIYESLKLAVEIGKWSDGRKLTQEQRELSLQALIAWEAQNLPEDQRTGY